METTVSPNKIWRYKRNCCKSSFSPYCLVSDDLIIIHRTIKTISTKYEFKVNEYSLLNSGDLVYEYSISITFDYPSWGKEIKKQLKHCKAIFIWNQNGLHSKEKMCTDTRGQWNLSCQQGLSRRVGQRCNFNQHLKLIIFPNVNSNTRGEFELWICMIFCTYIPPKVIYYFWMLSLLYFDFFPSEWCSFETNMCYTGINNISSSKTVKKHSVTS